MHSSKFVKKCLITGDCGFEYSMSYKTDTFLLNDIELIDIFECYKYLVMSYTINNNENP